MTRLAALGLILAIPACVVDATGDDATCPGGKCDGVDQSCPDKRYSNGTCDVQLDCAVPDIDCFRTFATDDEAAAWYAELEPRVAQLEGRPSRRIVPSSDPRFPKFRALLDRGWEAMRTRAPVGKLADARPGLVFVEDDVVNAFVDPEDLDKKRASFAVMIHTAVLDLPTTEDATLGLIMHELQHAVGLHVVAGVPERMQKFYFATEGNEPIGRRQQDNADLREAVEIWRSGAAEVGVHASADLRGMPLGGGLQRVFRVIFAQGVQNNPAGCANARTLAMQLVADLEARTDQVSTAIGTDATVGPRVTALLASLRDDCLADLDDSFYVVAAAVFGGTAAEVEASMTPEDRAAVAGKHVVDAVAALTESRRARMRAVEAAVATQLGKPWSAVRFFSEEEDADDSSVSVLRGAGLDPAGLGTFFIDVLMSKQASAACAPVLASGTVPAYGVDLLDTHHGNCWRTYHVRAYADDVAKKSRGEPVRLRAAAPTAPRVVFPPVPRISMH
jgi:hypothetical protein